MATAKSPVAATSPHSHDRAEDGAASYFPQQQQEQPHYHGSADAETLSNTLANSHVARPDHSNHLAAPVGTRPTKFTEEWDASQRGSSIIEVAKMQRSSSFSGSVAGGVTGEGAVGLSRGNTLKKKASLRRNGSLKRSSSRRSMKAGSVRSLALQSTTDQDEIHSAFYCPVPTAGTPTEVLANRFQAWRKILKDLITYFREIQSHYEHRAKSLLKLTNVLNNTATPPGFLASGGLDDALQILRNLNRQVVTEANKATEIEEDVILALTGLRNDLHQKIKEIKNLSSDFKNSVEKEMESTRRVVNHLQEALGQTELDSALTTGKQDPYLLRLAVDRQIEKQIDEENYLHQAYLNLENSGRELESIVVGEIQKSYNAYAGILKRESDAAYNAIEELRIGPVSMPKDTEWISFVQRDERFVDPDVPIRAAEFIQYPGRDHYACQEIRAGLLERKSKYLKSYTAGWYVLSPTHLHEFKSADKTQAPVMSLYLPEQKLGSHSTEGGSSNKFILKGRQTGSMHRGHTWVFRAESHDTMMAWYEDIKALTERTPEERSNFLRGHGRSLSRSSQRSSLSSDGMVDDDEDPPFTATAGSVNQQPKQDMLPRRPSGGRFPSDLQVNPERGLQVPLSPLSVSSGYNENLDRGFIAATGHLPENELGQPHYASHDPDSDYLGRSGAHQSSVIQPSSGSGLGGESIPHAASKHYGKSPIVGSQIPGTAPDEPWGPSSRGTGTGANSLPTGLRLPPSPTIGADSAWTGPAQSIAPDVAVDSATKGQQILSSESDGSFTNSHSSEDPVVVIGQYSGGATAGGTREVDLDASGGAIAQEGERLTRPVGGTVRNDSVPTISHLHIPGEYPRGSTSGFS
ncbi:hypothetical protein B0T24DRAFT_211227 [Lasiosphaeria ovina]|uniref:PH domain-containing protein n=1 Tax=Lasiosphaeria ovina TaxID=92902 RepID=A0AAE0NA86_9PEZI|nr:hypothetical protein B0T24DRAFT_211227 [Lasiosphaeria ovina]